MTDPGSTSGPDVRTTIRLGVVGAARILTAHLRGIAAIRAAGLADVRVTAIAARNRDDAATFRLRGEGPALDIILADGTEGELAVGRESAYREVALLSSKGESSWTDEKQMMESQRRKAAQLGANGTLSASAFRLGGFAQDADDRILYDPGSGNMFYDADGNGAGAAVWFAHVTPGLVLTQSDFVIVP